MGFSADTIREMARDVYGIELSNERAADIAAQVTEMSESARQAGRESDFNDELLSARQVLAQAAEQGSTS